MKRSLDKNSDKHRGYEPFGAAYDMLHCRAPEILIEGPAGTGKTRAVLEKAHHLAQKYPGMRGLLVRKTRRSMTESVLVTFEDKVIPADWRIVRHRGRALRESYRYRNGSTLVLGGMDRASRVMSSEYDFIAVFEARELTEDDWESLLTRLRNGRMPYHQAVADTNPDAPTHWLNRRAERGAMVRFRSRHQDNPVATRDYLDRLARLTGVRLARLGRGQWVAAEGAVYEQWDPTMHLLDRFPLPGHWRRLRSIDFGYTQPFVCQWWALDEDGRMYLYREIYMTRRLVADHAALIREHSALETIDATVADHDAEGRATLERCGVATLAASKTIGPGIQAVATRLRAAGDGRPRLFILRDSLVQRDEERLNAGEPWCTEQEFDSYVWAKRPGREIHEEYPTARHDHGMDAMRYAVAHVDGPGQQLSVRVMGASKVVKSAIGSRS